MKRQVKGFPIIPPKYGALPGGLRDVISGVLGEQSFKLPDQILWQAGDSRLASHSLYTLTVGSLML
jgi:hypothetical protein